MGLPIWRESSHDESQAKPDPTAHDRSSIRRHPTGRGESRRAHPNGAENGSMSDRQSRMVRIVGIGQPIIRASALRRARAAQLNRASSPDVQGSGRPQSRRGLPAQGSRGTTTRMTDNIHTGGTQSPPLELPPLRRMRGRNFAHDVSTAAFAGRRADTPPVANGLGDRRRSRSPDSPQSDFGGGWSVIGETITPDPSLPSAGNSFATADATRNDSRADSPSSNEDGGDGPRGNGRVTYEEFLRESNAREAERDADNCDPPSPARSQPADSSDVERETGQNEGYVAMRIERFHENVERFMAGTGPSNNLTMRQRLTVLRQMRDVMVWANSRY